MDLSTLSWVIGAVAGAVVFLVVIGGRTSARPIERAQWERRDPNDPNTQSSRSQSFPWGNFIVGVLSGTVSGIVSGVAVLFIGRALGV